MDRSELGIVIPAFNEEASIERVVKDASQYGKVIVVSDGSHDRTAENAQRAGAHIVSHIRNLGYDAALNSGFAEADKLGCKYVVTIDADGQHDAKLLSQYHELLENGAEIVVGVRPNFARWGEKLFAAFTHRKYGIHDPMCGMKGYRIHWYHQLGHADSYGSVGTELMLFAVKNGAKLAQISVPIQPRVGASRFGGNLKGNLRLTRALAKHFTTNRGKRENTFLDLSHFPKYTILAAERFDDSDTEYLVEHAKKFRSQWPNGEIICTFDLPPDLLDELEGITKLSDIVGYHSHQDFWEQAYEKLDSILGKFSAEVQSLLNAYYHTCATYLYQAISTIHVCKQTATPRLIIVRSCAPEGYRGLGYEVLKPVQAFETSTAILGRWTLQRLLEKFSWKLVIPYAHKKLRHGTAPIARLSKLFLKSGPVISESDHSHIGTNVWLAVEDSGTNVNLGPTLKIIQECLSRKTTPLTITTGKETFQKLQIAGYKTVLVGHPRPFFSFIQVGVLAIKAHIEFAKERARVNTGTAEKIFFHNIKPRLLEFTTHRTLVFRDLDYVRKLYPPKSVLMVNECPPLAAMLASWTEMRRIPALGFNPILMGKRPDNRFFPFGKHLVYGDQLADLMCSYGIAKETISVVGSPTYEPPPLESPSLAREIVSQKLHHSWKENEKLVIVGTEAFPEPLTEIVPILETLAKMDGIHTVLKIHPSDSLEYFEKLVANLGIQDKIDVIKDCPLDSLLTVADLLICVLSNIIVTAANLGTPTLVCDFSNKRRVLDFVEEGLCFGCFSPMEIRANVEAILFDQEKQSEWKQRKLPNIRRFNGANDGQSHRRIVDQLLDEGVQFQ